VFYLFIKFGKFILCNKELLFFNQRFNTLMVRHGIENIIFVKITFSEEQEFLPLAHNNLTEILTNLGNVKI